VEPAARWRYLDGRGDVGVIPSVTQPFCESCDRVRITAEGEFRTCLFALDEIDLRAELRAGGGLEAPDLDDRLAVAIERAVAGKWAGHRIGQVDFVRPNRSMSQIGG
jgi:cyclic pyranopterin phosphate synthase